MLKKLLVAALVGSVCMIIVEKAVAEPIVDRLGEGVLRIYDPDTRIVCYSTGVGISCIHIGGSHSTVERRISQK